MGNEKALSPVMGVILMAAVIAALVFGLSGSIKSIPDIHGGRIVECSQFFKVVDVYKTPAHFYVVIEGQSPSTIDEAIYTTLKPGDYVADGVAGFYKVNVTPLSELASGYRDACLQVIP
jgi:hypothetical protein